MHNISYNFGIIGASGYIAPRHLKAIKDNNSNLIIACDKSDSVGIIDNYFKNAYFCKSLKTLKKFIKNNKIDFLSICTPNNLHYSHAEFALNHNIVPICEKPLVNNLQEADQLINLKNKKNLDVFSISQLRYHKNVLSLKKRVQQDNKRNFVELIYFTPRGRWYENSWKFNQRISGGILNNIGIHLFDMLRFIFGSYNHSSIIYKSKKKISGFSKFEYADVNWTLSIDCYSKDPYITDPSRPLRLMKINNKKFEFDSGFSDLHSISYNEIINGRGIGIEDTYETLKIIHDINSLKK